MLPAGAAPVQVHDRLRPFPAGEYAEGQFRGHLSEGDLGRAGPRASSARIGASCSAGRRALRVRHTARVPLRFTLTSSAALWGLGVQYPLPPPPLLADGEVPDWDWLLVTGLPDVLRTYQVPPKLVMPSPFTAPGPESPEKV